MIIFDLDGTLIDSSIGIYEAYKDACLAHDFLCKSFSSFKLSIGPPFHVMFKSLHPDAEEYYLKNIPPTFSNLYIKEKYYNQFNLRSGTEEFLQRLSSKNTLSIVTNKQTTIAKSIIKTSNLLSFFDLVAGRDFFNIEHTKYNVFKVLLEKNIIPLTSLYIGDTNEDLQLSSELGINFIGLASLFGEGLSPQSFLPDYDRLEEYLNNI